MVASLVYSQVQIMPTDPGICFACWVADAARVQHRCNHAHCLRQLLVSVLSAPKRKADAGC